MSYLREFDPTRVTTDICAKCGAVGVPMVDAIVNGVEGATKY